MQSYTQKGDVEVVCDGKEWDIVVDGDKFNLIALTDEIKEHFEWGTNQKASMLYLDSTGQYLPLTSDAALRSLVDSNFLFREISVLVRVEDIVEVADADGNGNANCNGGDGPGGDGSGGDGSGADVNGGDGNDGDGSGADGDGNVVVGEKEMQQKASSKWQAMFWDDTPISNPEDPEDEPIGVNEKHLYGVVDLESQKEGTSGKKTDKEGSSGNEVATQDVPNDFDPQHVPEEEVPVDEIGNVVPLFVHNRENPTFVVDATFPNGEAFKLAMRQFAIKGEFEVNVSHSSKARYIAKCAKTKDCTWRIYARKETKSSVWKVI